MHSSLSYAYACLITKRAEGVRMVYECYWLNDLINICASAVNEQVSGVTQHDPAQ